MILPVIARHGAIFRAIGAGPPARAVHGIEAADWTEESEVAEVQGMEIGIMPVPDDPWARGKCGYKLIQYMACGLPVIASPVGVNSDIVSDGENGFLARGKEEWCVALERLLTDAPLRAAMGRAGRARAEEYYSLASQEPRLLGFLTDAVSVDRAA